MNREDFLKECIEYFGETKQQAVCVEEMAELTQQLCKFMIDHPNKNREKLVEEYVDVLIMLNQMKIIFNITDEEVENGKVFKLARLKKFIESRRNANRSADSSKKVGIVKDLSELLKEVDSLFVHKSRRVRLSSYDYTLGRFPYGWSFSVTNSWYKWSDAGLKHEFGAWSTPEAAVNEFLQYVKDNHVKVESLMDKSAEQSVERICTCRKNEQGEIKKYHAGCPEHDPANR